MPSLASHAGVRPPSSHRPLSAHRANVPPINTASLGALPLPPALTGEGVPVEMGKNGKLTKNSSRDSSRSRPTTPSNNLMPSGQNSPVYTSSPTHQKTPNSAKAARRRSWMPGKHEKSTSQGGTSKAWIAGLREHVPYDINPLIDGERVRHKYSLSQMILTGCRYPNCGTIRATLWSTYSPRT